MRDQGLPLIAARKRTEQKAEPDAGWWLDRRQAARFFGISDTWLREDIRAMLAPEHVRHVGARKKLEFWGPAVHAALVKRAEAKGQRQSIGSDGDPMLVGAADSPALERYRAARAQREELALDRDRGEYIARDEVRRGYALAALPVRRFGEWLARHVGMDAAEQFRRAVDQSDRVVARMANTSEVEPNDTGGNERG